ncbi:MAG: CPBP family intramembrane metalloprotease [Candidatus Marinimicrobia bacterium]|nr:CPBP family intramembrane metalloprotease [Candidatus Neomarinimicrobiota bacterium]
MKTHSIHIFSKREAYFLVASSMFLGLFVTLALQGLTAGFENKVLIDRLIVLFGELALLVAPLLVLKQRGIRVPEIIPLKQFSPFTLLMAIMMVTGVIGLVSVYEVIILPYFPIPAFLQDLDVELSQGGAIDILILVVAGSIVAPLVEEFLFRGILQQSLFYRYGSLLPAMVVPTVIFALFHVAYLFYFPALFELITLALLLGWLMAKTGNLIISVIVHGLFNLSSFSGIYLFELDETTTLSDLGLPWLIISVLLSLLGWIYFKSMPLSVQDDVYLIPPLKKKEH